MICGPAAWPGRLLDTCRVLDPVVRCNESVCFSPDSQATHAQASLGVPVSQVASFRTQLCFINRNTAGFFPTNIYSPSWWTSPPAPHRPLSGQGWELISSGARSFLVGAALHFPFIHSLHASEFISQHVSRVGQVPLLLFHDSVHANFFFLVWIFFSDKALKKLATIM